MSIDDTVDKVENSFSKKSTISDLLDKFGGLFSKVVSEKYSLSYKKTELNEYQFAIVYKYIIDNNKSDRQAFRGKSSGQTNVKAVDFVSGLQKYIHDACVDIAKDAKENTGYSLELFNDLDLIRKQSNSSLAQSLSTRINRYDTSKMIITSIYDALQRGVSVDALGKLLSQHYSLAKNDDSRYGTPLYRQYIDRQKAIINFGK
ncbi:MAG: hypothetical protein ACP5OA_01345 [Candidatus Woesearchaeota archaeon]